ncbi:helix-turn-helix domain-containing protein [Kitasatospora griseola]|uniref:hypothetical protein n=1 Tax=Kitasatospora griseola TaxID=2064 RepID=UPI00381E702F
MLTSFSIPPDNRLAGWLSCCVCLTGLALMFADVFQLGLRRDRKVLAHLGKEPSGARVQQIGTALRLSDNAVATSLDRLTADGFLIREAGDEPLPMRTYRLAD